MLKIGNVIKLSNKKEYVISAITYDNDKMYLYLVNTNCKDIKFVYLDNDEVIEIEDKNKILELISLFGEQIINSIY